MARKLIGIIALLYCLNVAGGAIAQDNRAELKARMSVAFGAFSELLPYIYDQAKLSDQKNHERVSTLLRVLDENFSIVQKEKASLSNDAGFSSTVKALSEMLSDARNRYAEGNTGYAAWRLKTVSNHCISCHTRYEVKVDYQTVNKQAVSDLKPLERAEYFLATRQFAKAENLFIEVAKAENGAERMEALRKWLVMVTRVHPNPQKAVSAISKLRAQVKFSGFDEEEILKWLSSLRRWMNEGKVQIDPLKKAENLIMQGLGTHDPLSAGKSPVELLRGSSMLHTYLESDKNIAPQNRARALYLLGLVYSELPLFFINELPELFLEQVIRDYPGSTEAKQAFRRYEELVTLNFTGSGGTHLPDDVKLGLSELHDLAYGVPQITGRI